MGTNDGPNGEDLSDFGQSEMGGDGDVESEGEAESVESREQGGEGSVERSEQRGETGTDETDKIEEELVGAEGRTSQNTQLSREDVSFLRAVRDINATPEEYPKTESGETPATGAAIKHATSLSRSQVNYRIGTSTNTRGFVERGFLKSYDPPMTNTGFGSRSAELTEKGEQRLEDGLRAYGLAETESRGDPEVMDRLEDLGAQVEKLNRRVDKLEDRLEDDLAAVRDDVEATDAHVERIEEAQMGAIDEQQAARLRTVVDAMPAFYRAFKLLGVDVRDIQEADELSDAEIETILESVREALEES